MLGDEIMTKEATLAAQIVDACLHVKKGENVWVHSWDHTLDIASEVAFACQQRGAYANITAETGQHWLRSLRELPKTFLEVLPGHQAAAFKKTDVFVFMLGPRSPVDWSKIPSEKQELADVWYMGSGKYAESWRSLARQHEVRMLGVEYCLATEERAEMLGLELKQWRSVMLDGCLANQKEISERARMLSEIMRTGKEVIVETQHGTNLRFRLVERKPSTGDSIVSDEDAAAGIVKFIPSGFVETAPDEESAEGVVVYDCPVLVRGGKRIEGLTLKFSSGKIVSYSALSGLEAFKKYLESGTGDIDRIGFFGLGLNPGLKHGFTQDDKVLGGVTIGIGGNEDKGGRNRTNGNDHWWASMTQATVHIDEIPVLVRGNYAS